MLKNLVDVHSHLDQLGNNLEVAIYKAKKAGVCSIITNGVDIGSNRKSLEISSKYGIVKSALGVFPTDALKMTKTALASEISFIRKNKSKIVAIGEVGLDMFHSKDKKVLDRQKEIFQKFITLAERTKLPLTVHSRKAEKECIEMLESSTVKKVIMHCFTGKLKLAKKIADNGWYLSITPKISINKQFQKLAEEININNLLTESDAPLQSPIPGKPNEPAFVAISIKKIAEIKGLNQGEVADNIYMNYRSLF